MEKAKQDGNFRWLVTQVGSRENYAIPLAFHRLGILRRCFVDIWCRWARGALLRGNGVTRALAGRFHPEIPSNLVVSFDSGAVALKAAHFLGHGSPSARQAGEQFCRFGGWLAQRVRRCLEQTELDTERDLFFGFNTSCLETLELLRQRRIFTVVDQVDPGKIEEDIVLEEAERWPGWTKVHGRMPECYWERLSREWELADLVLVNSQWSADALVQQGVERKKIIVVPLAIDTGSDAPHDPMNPEGSLRILWLGNVILRKGIQYLAEAARRLQKHNVEFTVAGPIGISDRAVRSLPVNMRLLGRVTRDQLGSLYRQAHLFVLPTISDGFAVTQLEAMARGLPVVTTPNCGRVVTHGSDGFIVPARNSNALADALAQLNSNRGLLREMSKNAVVTATRYKPSTIGRLIHSLTLAHRGGASGVQNTLRLRTAQLRGAIASV